MSSAILQIGFVPLVDCALLAIAQEKHFFAAQGLCVELRKAQSWGALRDNLLSGMLDAAHLLITIPVQSAISPKIQAANQNLLCYGFNLSRNGNGIILANQYWNQGVRDASGLAGFLEKNPNQKLRFGIVFSQGTQEYFLRSWLGVGNLSISNQISLTIIPPQEMVGRLRKGEIDGFCAGDPWTRRATASKLGRLVAASRAVYPGLGEKVLGVRKEWHEANSKTHGKLIRALKMAQLWLENLNNRLEAIEIIASKKYVNTPKNVVEGALQEALEVRTSPVNILLNRFLNEDPNIPNRSHLQWYVEQMQKFGHVSLVAAARFDASELCLEKFYLESIQPLTANNEHKLAMAKQLYG